MERKDHIDPTGAAILIAFSLLLAVNQVVIKLTNEAFQPVFQAGLRSAIGASALFIWMLYRGIPLRIAKGTAFSGVFIGFLFAAEFLSLFLALDITTVSRSSIIFYSMPVWLAIAGHFLLPSERMGLRKAIGLGLAMLGVVIAILGNVRGQGEGELLGDLLALSAAMCWAGIALTARVSRIAKEGIEIQLMWQLVVSAIVFLAISPLFGDFLRNSAPIYWLSVIGQGVIIVFAAFLLWFWLIKTYPASGVASFSFLTPVIGVLLGWLLLDETIGVGILAALGCVAIGLILINWPARKN